MAVRSLVSVVDDDESVRESLPDLLSEFGFASVAFSSGQEFLASEFVDQTRCAIVDISMPGMTGPDLQRELGFRGHQIPIIFITAYENENIFSRLLEREGVQCLLKPFSDAELRKALDAAFGAS